MVSTNRVPLAACLLPAIAAVWPAAAFAQRATNTVVTAAPNPVQIGQSVQLKAQVYYTTSVTTAIFPTGTVAFTINGAAIPGCAAQRLSNGAMNGYANAACTATFSQAGIPAIGAAYSGDSGSAASAGSVNLTVMSAATVTVALKNGLAQVGQILRLTASVSNGGVFAITGSVAFSSDGNPIPGCSAIPVQSPGTANCDTGFPQVGSVTITASYGGDSYNTSASGSMTLSIGKAYATPSIQSYVQSMVLNHQYYASQTIEIDATFAQAASVRAPTGNVAFYDGSKLLATVPLSGVGYAKAVLTAPSVGIPPFALGAHSITATYAGDDYYQSSSTTDGGNGPLVLTIAQTPTTPYISANPNGIDASGNRWPLSYGQPVIFGASFPPPPGTGIAPTGSVSFYDGSTLVKAVTIDATGHAQFSIPSDSSPPLSVGTHLFKAVYSGDAVYLPSDTTNEPLPNRKELNPDGLVALTFNPAQVNLVLSSPRFEAGKPLIVSAQPVVISPGIVSAGGTIDFTVGGGAVAGCTGLPANSGQVQCRLTLQQPATVNARYSGDIRTAAATATLALSAALAVPGIYLETATTRPVLGQSITVDVRLAGPPGTPAPTGIVTFRDTTGDPAISLGAAPVTADGRALLVIPSTSLSLGSHYISAAYDGDSNYQAATAPSLEIRVSPDPTTLVVASPQAQIGQTLAVNVAVAAVSPGTAIPTGTVTIFDGQSGSSIGSCTLVPQNSAGQCSLVTAPLGSLSFVASYGGDLSASHTSIGCQDAACGSAPQRTFPAVKALAGIYLNADLPTPPVGTPVAIAAVLIAAPGVAAPTGSVTFLDNGTILASAPITGGRATISPTLSFGNHDITAVYGGDPNYEASPVPALIAIVVSKATTKLDLAPSWADGNQPVTLKASVSILGPDLPEQTGTVDFTNGGVAIAGCAGVPLQNGVALCTATFPQPGTYTITAAYRGGPNVAAVSGSVQLSVGKMLYLAAYSTTLPYGAGVGIRALLMGTPMPTGTVTFSDGSSILAKVPVGSDGTAPLTIPSGTLPPLAVGTHTIAAAYSGDAKYAAASAASLSIMITKAATSVAIYVAPPQINQPVLLKASVTVVSPAVAAPGGTVDFSSGGVPIAGCTGVALQSGSAFCNATFSRLTNVTVTAAYGGDANTSPSTYNVPISVGKAAAGFYVAADASTAPYGAPLTVGALMEAATGVAPPTGTVTFSEAGGTLAAVAVGPDGRASVFIPSATLKPLSVGQHSIVAVYSGDSNYQGSPPAGVVVTIGKASTTLAVASTPPQISQPVTLKAAVTVVSPGSATPTGTVDFTSGGAPLKGCTGLTVQNGIATCTAGFAQLGTLAVAATYGGDDQTASSTASMQLAIGKAVAAMYTATDSPNPPYGAKVTVNALLLGADGVAAATGTVTFSDGEATLAAVAVGADGRASLAAPSDSLKELTVGPHSIVASYSGDTNYQPSVAAALNIVVVKASVTVAVASTPAQVNQATTLKAAIVVVDPGVAIPSGTVDFTNDGSAIPGCMGLSLQAGAALCTTTFADAGACTIGARYSGDATTSDGSASIQLAAGKAVAGMSGASAPAAPVFGVPVVLRALMLGAAGVATPTGSVTFSEGNAILGTAPVDADGHASLTLAAGALPAGPHVFNMGYSGDTSYAGATATLTVAVSKASTATVLAAQFGMPFTATVNVLAPGAGSPTGTVQFFVGDTPAGTAPVSTNGGASTAIIPAGPWNGTAWAEYSGDANFAGSASASVVVAPGAALSIASDHNPATAGQPVTFTVVVAPASSGIAPAGRVEIVVDGVTLGSAPVVAGTATVSAAAALAAGSHTVVANYSGDSVYPAASATFVQLITNTLVSLTLSASPANSVYGQPVMLTAQAALSSGTVQFLDGSTPLGSAPIQAGAATLALANLTVGNHAISATWMGDGGTNSAASLPLSLTVAKAQTSTVLRSSGGSLTAVVSAVAPGTGTPAGSVKFVNASNNSVFAFVTLGGGAAIVAQPATADPILAIYSGDTNFAGSTSLALASLAATNAASFTSGSFAPDEIVTLFGTNLAATTVVSTSSPAASLGGTTAGVTDSSGVRRAASLLFVSPSQASLIVPPGTPDGPAVIAITTAAGATYAIPQTVARVAPGLFTADGSGKGAPVGQTIRVRPDGAQDAPGDLAAGPIDLGNAGDAVYLVLYGTGIRHQSTATAAFTCATCSMGDQPVAYAGAQGMAGLDQVNLALPAALRGAGHVTLTLTVDGVNSNAVTLTFR